MDTKWLIISILCIIGGLSLIPSIVEDRKNRKIFSAMTIYCEMAGIAGIVYSCNLI